MMCLNHHHHLLHFTVLKWVEGEECRFLFGVSTFSLWILCWMPLILRWRRFYFGRNEFVAVLHIVKEAGSNLQGDVHSTFLFLRGAQIDAWQMINTGRTSWNCQYESLSIWIVVSTDLSHQAKSKRRSTVMPTWTHVGIPLFLTINANQT